MSDKCLPTRTQLSATFGHILLAFLVSWGYQTPWEYYTGPPS